MNKSKIHDSDIIDPVSDYFGKFHWGNWINWEKAHILHSLRIDNIDMRIKDSVVDKYE
jgi:hypothetical protein